MSELIPVSGMVPDPLWPAVRLDKLLPGTNSIFSFGEGQFYAGRGEVLVLGYDPVLESHYISMPRDFDLPPQVVDLSYDLQKLRQLMEEYKKAVLDAELALKKAQDRNAKLRECAKVLLPNPEHSPYGLSAKDLETLKEVFETYQGQIEPYLPEFVTLESGLTAEVWCDGDVVVQGIVVMSVAGTVSGESA